MDIPAAAAQGLRRCSPVVERKLDELCACLEDALSSSRQQRRSPYPAEERLRAEIKAKTDFLRSLLAAEAECHGGAGAGSRRPEHLAEAEARFAVLEATFDQWARRAVVDVDAPEPVDEEEEEEERDGDDVCSGSSCSCTDSCHEAKEDGEGEDAKRDGTVQEARDGEGTAADGRRRCWWRRMSAAAAWCGAAGVVAVVAVGLAVELAAVVSHSHHSNDVSVYVVPT